MASFVLNVARGRMVEKLDTGAADLIVVPLSAIEADATVRDYATIDLATVLALPGNTEQTGSTWSRKVHLNAAITVTPEHATDRQVVFLDADDIWLAPAVGNDTVALLICEDGAADANRTVLIKMDFPVTTDGTNIKADYDATDGIWYSD